MRKYLVGTIRLYQAVNRTLIAHGFLFARWSGCRHWPTCSEFTIQAIQKHGVVRGIWKGVHRVLRCNPLIPSSL